MLLAVLAGLVMAVAALLFIAATPDTASAFQAENADVWAGWSVDPEPVPDPHKNRQDAFVTVVQADWIVPKVGCASAGPHTDAFRFSRAAVFVGMWGRLDEVTNWLPQVGTVSNCRQGGVTNDYYAWVELYPKPQEKLFKVEPHDRIHAQVSGYRQRNGQLTFHLYIRDYDREYRGQQPYQGGKNLSTSRGVALENVAYHGGCIVEGAHDGALAKFSQPIWFAPVTTSASASGCQVNGEGIGSYPGNALYRYDMNSIVGSAKVGKPRAESTFPDKNGRFTVTWKRFQS